MNDQGTIISRISGIEPDGYEYKITTWSIEWASGVIKTAPVYGAGLSQGRTLYHAIGSGVFTWSFPYLNLAPRVLDGYKLRYDSHPQYGGGLYLPESATLYAPATVAKLSEEDVISLEYDYTQTNPRYKLQFTSIETIEENPTYQDRAPYWKVDVSTAYPCVYFDKEDKSLGHYIRGVSLTSLLPEGSMALGDLSQYGTLLWSDD